MPRECRRLAVILALAASPLSTHAEPGKDSILDNLKVMDAKEARKSDPFALLRDKPMTDNPTLVPMLKATSGALPPPYLYELARRLWPTNRDEAFEWFALGMARARYDALRCKDTTSHQGIGYLPGLAPEIMQAIETERKAFGEAGLRAMERPDLFVDTVSPSWICMHGIKAIQSALGGKPMAEADWLVPSAEWQGLRDQVRKDLRKFFVEQGKPQDDPIPMTTARFPRTTLYSPFVSSYNWLDAQRLVWARADKDNDGKTMTRLVLSTAAGDREEVATTRGFWCAGNGVVSYQTGTETLPDKTYKLTLSTGSPGKWVSSTLELRSLGFGLNFGAQGFGGSWVAPIAPRQVSPFDCRWEANAELSGPRNQNTRVPLLPGDGAIQFLADADATKVRWIDAAGKVIQLPLDGRHVARSSVRHVPWKSGYFIGQSWSRFTHKEKTLPACIPGVFIHPREGRIEESCTPFDAENTANAVMVHPIRLGWLRGTVYRNTAHGVKTGGIYLLRPGGKPEKLVDTQLESWNLSPDGCQLAFAHRPASGQAALEIIDLCRES